ncbi:MAG: hypothetical protein AAFR91_02865 [Pseudomonadota bacterium]
MGADWPKQGGWLRLVAVASLVGCALASNAFAVTGEWWDTDYLYRQNVAVTTGATQPDRGYSGYTLRIAALNTQALIASGQMQADCDDLRVLYFDGAGWQELVRHVIDCGSVNSDIRFASPIGLVSGATDDDFYLYYGNSAAAAPASVSTSNVYLWFDDATTNRASSYIRGRVDPWHGNGWDNSLVWNSAGYYTYDNGDNFASAYRLAVDERDVFIEAEFFHTDCYALNMTTGVLVRGIIASGNNQSEQSNHYYTTNRGEQARPGCTAGGYNHDGAIMRRQRGQIAVQGTNPGDIINGVWRRQALAAFSVNPSRLRFWDADNAITWAALGFPDTTNLLVGGDDNNDVEGRGFVAVMTAQDEARLRNILVRRYVEPEPALVLGAQELFASPELTVFKTVRSVSDPINGALNPYAIPGSIVEYEIEVVNQGSGAVDLDSLVITDRLSTALALIVDDLAPASGPVRFEDGAGSQSSGLSLTFSGLSNAGDGLAFSSDGVSFTYTPIPGPDGSDTSVRALRINLSGVMNPATSGDTRFSIFYRTRVR